MAVAARGWRMTDVWASAEQFQTFAAPRLNPDVARVGIAAEPRVEIYPAHRTFTPGYTWKG